MESRVVDDLNLVQRMLAGEQRAFDEFFAAYATRLAAFAARRSSLQSAALEDVVQMTMINAIRGLATFRGGSALYTWLCQICRNQLADVKRREARRPREVSIDEFADERPTAQILQLVEHRDPLDECAEDSTRGNVRRIVNALPASHARILELRYGDEMTVPEIARVLQISEDAAESRLVRARQSFRGEWQRIEPGAGASREEKSS